MAGQCAYRFGPFRLDATGRLLCRGDEVIPLPPKVTDALLLLIRNAPNVVDKQELLRTIWPNTFIEEGSLTRTISVLRKTLGGSGNGEEYVATIPKRGYRFATSVEVISDSAPAYCPQPEKSGRLMLAVLPFESLSEGQRQEYFSDGLTEEMITELGRLNPQVLGVIARTSAMQYKATKKDIRQIGAELGVTYILEGSVRRAGNRVRIAAQLIQVADQTHLWAETYERNLGDILLLQRDVAQAIAREIKIKLVPQEETGLPAPRPVNSKAYEAYLKGRYFWNRRNKKALWSGLRHFELAIKEDSTYAPAYAGMADCYLTLHDYGYLPATEALVAARRTANQALRIDDSLAEAHTSLGHACLHEFDWFGAERAFQRAIELNPNYPAGHFYYANYLVAMGRFEEAVTEARRALELDPVALPCGTNLAGVLYHARQSDQSIAQSLRVLESDSGFAPAYDDLGRAYEQKGMYREAIHAFQRAVEYSGRGSSYIASLAHAYALAGKRREALKLLKELESRATKEYVPAYPFALVYTGLNQKDKAFAWLAKACDERSGAIPFLKVNPRLVSLRGDPRFEGLLSRLGLAVRANA